MKKNTTRRAGKSVFSLLLLGMFLLLVEWHPSAQSFIVSPPTRFSQISTRVAKTRMFATLPDIKGMKAGDIRKELESYGISTKSFLEKKEMVEALENARKEGKKPVDNPSSSGSSSSSGTSSGGESREAKLAKEMEKAKKMKVGDLKKELTGMGISTKSFFEKTEFVKAYAEAMVDGVKGANGAKQPRQQEKYDPSYRDVAMQKFDQRMIMGGRPVIDVKLAK